MTNTSDQKKVVALGIILSVLGGIWIVRLGIIPLPSGATPSAAADGPSDKALATDWTLPKGAQAQSVTWKRPEAIPETIKDPMKLSVIKLPKAPEPTPTTTSKPNTESQLNLMANHSTAGDTVNITTERMGRQGAPVQLDEKTPVFFVKGIIFNSAGRSSILIDSSILHEDDDIHGATIHDITRRTVTFKKNHKSYVVRVGQDFNND